MAYVIQRGARFTGYYRRNGKRVSAGTFASRKEAFKAAILAEDGEEQSVLDVRLAAYVEQWLPKADCLPITRKGYEAVLRKHVLPILGEKKISQITRGVVRNMLTELRAKGVGDATIAQCKAALGAAFRPLVEEEAVPRNPTHGVKVKQHSQPITHLLEPEEFQRIVGALPQEAALFARFLVTSGCRFGEASELRIHDVNFKTGEVYVQRRVSEIGKEYNHGQRFLVVDATKSGHKRTLVISSTMLRELELHAKKWSLGNDDLLFSSALVLGRGKLGSHLPRDAWRRKWKEAIEQSGIEWSPRTHDLRHANATLLLKNGVDVHEVKERLGHQSIRTTERYLHRLRSQQSKAAEAVKDYLGANDENLLNSYPDSRTHNGEYSNDK